MNGNTDDKLQGTRRTLVDNAVSLGLIALVVVLTYQIFSPLFPAILWGLLLAVICAHPYERLVSRLHGQRAVADAAFAVILLLVLLIPALFFAWELITYFPIWSEWLERFSAEPLPTLPQWLIGLPVIGPSIETFSGSARTDLDEAIPGIVSHMGGVAFWATERIGTFAAFLFQFTLGAIVSIFILHNRFAIRAFLNRALIRTGGEFAGTLFTKALDTTRTAFVGVIYASIVQTLLASVALFFAGLPGIVLFAGFTFLLALVQVGPVVVLIVADAILLLEGRYLATALVTAWFLGVVMTSDNLIRPYFSSQGSDLPGIIAFLGTVGGFLTWGLIGVFLGPVLTSVIFEMILVWLDPDRTRADAAGGPN